MEKLNTKPFLDDLDALSALPPNYDTLTKWSDLEIALHNLEVDLYWNAYTNMQNELARQNLDAFNEFVIEEIEPRRPLLKRHFRGEVAKLNVSPTVRNYVENDSTDMPDVPEALLVKEKALASEYVSVFARANVPGRGLSWRESLNTISDLRDREARKSLWLETYTAIKSESALDKIALALFETRQQIAAATEMSFVNYVWQKQERQGYTASDSLSVLKLASEAASVLHQKFYLEQASLLEVEQLRPWDAAFVPQGQDSGQAQLTKQDYIQLIRKGYALLDPELGSVASALLQSGKASLMRSSNKVSGNMSHGYIRSKPAAFVITQGTGNVTDLRVMLHEFGHAAHLNLDQSDLFWNAFAHRDMMELFAYACQVLSVKALAKAGDISDEIHGTLKRYMRRHILNSFHGLAWREIFTHKLYQQSSVSSDRLDELWLSSRPSQPGLNVNGLESLIGGSWRWHQHLQVSPLYNSEYIFAWLTLLNFLPLYEENPEAGMVKLKDGMRLGKQITMVQFCESIGLQFPFGEREIGIAMETLDTYF